MHLRKAIETDIGLIREMQHAAFAEMLERYRDYDMSPACESEETIRMKFMQEKTTYYLICTDDDRPAGAVRVVDAKDGSRKRVSPIFILKEFRGQGLAQHAFAEIEKLYGSDHWALDTILQEPGNCYLYEKLGYVRTGQTKKINDRMDIIYYEKN